MFDWNEKAREYVSQFVKKWVYDDSVKEYERQLSYEEYASKNNYRYHYSYSGVPEQGWQMRPPMIIPTGIIIFTYDISLSRRVPVVSPVEYPPAIKPIVLYYWGMPDTISVGEWHTLSKVPIFFLWIIDNSTCFDFVIEKIFAFQQNHSERDIGYILVSKERSNPYVHVFIDKKEFLMFRAKRVRDRQTIITRVVECSLPKNFPQTWLLHSESSAEDVAIFSLLLLKHFISSKPIVSSRILHFYKPDGREDLSLKLAKCGIQYRLIENDSILFGTIGNYSYSGVQLANATKDNEDTAMAINSFFSLVNPDLIIFDAPFFSKIDSAVGKVILTFSGLSFLKPIVWVCARKNTGFLPWPPENIVEISRFKITSMQYLLSGKLQTKISSSPDWKFLEKYSFVVQNQPSPKSEKHGSIISEIARLTSAGIAEAEIAKMLGKKLHTITQLKRRFGIRVNAPFKHKRRTGLDKKIIALHQKQFSIQNIAEKLKCRPSYIEKRIDAWKEKEQKVQCLANEEHDTKEPANSQGLPRYLGSQG